MEVETAGVKSEIKARSGARYNGFVDAGVDADFGRTTLGGGFGKPVRLDTEPFYALPCSAAVLSTYAGLKVDAQMRVMRASGKPIANLFAAGEVVGGFHGLGCMSGSSLGKAAIFGRIAGRLAVTGA
ncbi:MAG: FAD-binding protein [Burkholderiaceae bacterium]|nr:FAD-binding protein [Desulfobacterales bacterium]MDP3138067.1 FAD-binding protein [Burkholderiaceae bacterium]